MAPIAIRPPRRDELRAGAALLARELDFGAADAIPPWLMHVTDGCGGITLVALDGAEVVGFSHAFPDLSREDRGLYSCGLAIAPPRRGLGIGRALKLEQRRRARRAGYRFIRWTADPRNGPALGLYLSGLGARLTAYHPDLHGGLRHAAGPTDDVEIVWALAGAGGRPCGETRWVALGGAEALPRVRAGMEALLAEGFVGVAVDRAGPHGRPRVAFRRCARAGDGPQARAYARTARGGVAA
jgi:predicted GNAT superfamily acetyltransferase